MMIPNTKNVIRTPVLTRYSVFEYFLFFIMYSRARILWNLYFLSISTIRKRKRVRRMKILAGRDGVSRLRITPGMKQSSRQRLFAENDIKIF